MKELNEYTAELHRRIEEEAAYRNDMRKRVTAALLTTVPLLLVLVIGGVWMMPRLHPIPETVLTADTVVEEAAPEAAEVTVPEAVPEDAMEEAAPEGFSQTTVQETSEAPDSCSYDTLPPLPATNTVLVTGGSFTDAEAKAYLAEHLPWYSEALRDSGEQITELRIEGDGYSHLCYGEGQYRHLELRQNFRDYLLYDGDRLVAVVTLSKENGTIYDTMSFGSDWFDEYNTFLKTHDGERLVWLYAGRYEIILAPNGSAISPARLDLPSYLHELEHPYEWFSEHLPE